MGKIFEVPFLFSFLGPTRPNMDGAMEFFCHMKSEWLAKRVKILSINSCDGSGGRRALGCSGDLNAVVLITSLVLGTTLSDIQGRRNLSWGMRWQLSPFPDFGQIGSKTYYMMAISYLLHKNQRLPFSWHLKKNTPLNKEWKKFVCFYLYEDINFR